MGTTGSNNSMWILFFFFLIARLFMTLTMLTGGLTIWEVDRLCGISQTSLNLEPFYCEAARRFVFCKAYILNTSGSKDRSVSRALPSVPSSSCLSVRAGKSWEPGLGRGWRAGWVTLALSPLSAAAESVGLPYQTSSRPAGALYFMALSCVRSCPLGRSCQRKT